MDALIRDLQRDIDGEVKSDEISRRIYSIDASQYKIEPRVIVLPKHRDDVFRTLEVAVKHGIPVVPRGAATGLTGGCLGPGIVIDLSRHMNKVLKIDYERGMAVCEPGVVQDQLNAQVAAKGWRFGPDTSTGNRATLGGMLGNNASGAHSIRYGKTVDNLVSTEVMIGNGEVLTFKDLDEAAYLRKLGSHGTEGNVFKIVDRVRQELKEEVLARFPKIQRRVSGYNLDELVKPGKMNLSKLVCGSEGSLGVCSQLTVKLVRSPKVVGLCVVHFKDLIEGLRTVEFMLQFKPFSLELIDEHIIALGKVNPIMKGQLDWLVGEPRGLLVVEFDADTEQELHDKLKKFEAGASSHKVGYARVPIITAAGMAQVWKLRKAGLGLLMGRRSHERAITFMEDVAVAPAKLADFMTDFRGLITEAGKEAGFYGHASVGCVHVRPMMDLRQEKDVKAMVQMMHDVGDLVAEYGGAISGEHGDGLVRSWMNEKAFGPTIYQTFKDLKRAFDPKNLLNPGKVVDGQQPDENLRTGPHTHSMEFETQMDFSKEGGFAFAVSMCNGNGECRKPDKGSMCPSYQASNDESYTTRARAQALQGLINADFSTETLAGQGLHEVLDWCLQCKGCQSECPSNVDMAKLKSEVLFHYQQVHGVPWRSKVFGAIDRTSPLGVRFSGLANRWMKSDANKWLLGKIGIDPRRALPAYTDQSFTDRWGALKVVPPLRPTLKVVLFADTFTQHNNPEIGLDAARVLRALNCEVKVLPYRCCGRPLISKGLLTEAKAKAKALIDHLLPSATEGWRIVGLEPSCILSMRDEYPALVPGEDAERLAKACTTFDELVADLVRQGGVVPPFRRTAAEVWLHPHCHQRAVVGTAPTLAALRAVPGFQVKEIASGCCGMAGTFGYETEHYDFSMKVGETRLFPALRALPADAIVVANGISCRHQIHDGVERRAQHLAQVLAAVLASPEGAAEAPSGTSKSASGPRPG